MAWRKDQLFDELSPGLAGVTVNIVHRPVRRRVPEHTQDHARIIHNGSTRWPDRGASNEVRTVALALRRSSESVLGYFFDACRTGCVTAFASDLQLIRSGIAARFTTVFLATFHDAGAGNVGTGVFLRCCHTFLLHSPGMKRTSPL
jgi:hypothetical protein